MPKVKDNALERLGRDQLIKRLTEADRIMATLHYSDDSVLLAALLMEYIKKYEIQDPT